MTEADDGEGWDDDDVALGKEDRYWALTDSFNHHNSIEVKYIDNSLASDIILVSRNWLLQRKKRCWLTENQSPMLPRAAWDIHVTISFIYVCLKDEIGVYRVEDLRHIRTISMPGNCESLVSMADTLIVKFDGDSRIKKMTEDGVVRSESAVAFSHYGNIHLAASESSHLVCVCDREEHSVSIISGDLQSVLHVVLGTRDDGMDGHPPLGVPAGSDLISRYPGLRGPRGLCIDGDRVFVCSEAGYAIIEIRTRNRKHTKHTLLTEENGVWWPRSITYNSHLQRLVVGCGDRIRIYQHKRKDD